MHSTVFLEPPLKLGAMEINSGVAKPDIPFGSLKVRNRWGFFQRVLGIDRSVLGFPALGAASVAWQRLYKPFLRGRRQTRSTTSRASLGFPYGKNQYD